MGYIVAVCTIFIAVIRQVGGAVVYNGAVHRRPTGVHILVVVVVWVIVSLIHDPVAIPSVVPLIPVLPLRSVVRINDVPAQFGFQLLAAFAHLVPIDLLQLMWLQHVYLGLLLHVGGSQVLFRVVVSSEGSALAHKTSATKDKQENQEENPTHRPANYGAQAAVMDGGQGGGGEQGSVLVHICPGSGRVAGGGGSGAGGCGGGGRICKANIRGIKPVRNERRVVKLQQRTAALYVL